MTIEATLYGIIDKHGKKISFASHPTTRAELLIHTSVIIQPKVLAVPWDFKAKSRLLFTIYYFFSIYINIINNIFMKFYYIAVGMILY